MVTVDNADDHATRQTFDNLFPVAHTRPEISLLCRRKSLPSAVLWKRRDAGRNRPGPHKLRGAGLEGPE